MIAIHTSKIGIDIENLIIDTDAEEKINEDVKIYVYLLLFNKIKLFIFAKVPNRRLFKIKLCE